MKPRTSVILLLLTTFVLTVRGVWLIQNERQNKLRLITAETGLQRFWENFVETPKVIVDDQPESTASVELRRLWGEGEQSQIDYRQEVIRLINEQRQIERRKQSRSLSWKIMIVAFFIWEKEEGLRET